MKETFEEYCKICPSIKDCLLDYVDSCKTTYNYQQQKIDALEDLFGTAMLELKSSIQSKIEAQRKIETLENQLTLANDKIHSLRYFSHAHFLYKFEQDFVEKRDNINNINFSGGFGYVSCVVITKDELDVEKEYYISDDFMASILLDYWDVKTTKDVNYPFLKEGA